MTNTRKVTYYEDADVIMTVEFDHEPSKDEIVQYIETKYPFYMESVYDGSITWDVE